MNKVYNAEDRELYKSMLPHGSITVIAERIGLSKQAVSQFLNGKTNSKTVENAVLDYIVELKQKRNAKLRKAGLL